MSWTIAVISGCSLLLFFLVWKEAGRVPEQRLVQRLFATVVMAGALAALALPLSYSRQEPAGATQTAVLLTEGFRADSVEAYLSRLSQQPVVYTMAPSTRLPASVPYEQVDPDSLQALLQKHQSVHVFGWGFTSGQLEKLKGSIVFHPSPFSFGLQSVHWNGGLQKGSSLLLQGRYHNGTPEPLKLVLGGLQTGLDSVVVKPGSDTLFTLATNPKFTGKALYNFTVLSGADTVEKEQIPVQVDSSASIRILVLASSPDFENKFLTTWLSAHGYEVAVRTSITTGKVNRLYVNAGEKPLEQLSASLLQRFDLLVSDPSALSALKPAEMQTLRDQVSQQGLGLVVRADSLLPRLFFAPWFPLAQTADTLPKKLSLHIRNPVPDTAAWMTGQPFFIRPQPGTQPLVESSLPGPVASSALAGTGRVVLTTVNNSFSWLLAGKEKPYAAFWSLLIRKALQRTPLPEGHLSPALPIAGEPVWAAVQTDRSSIPDMQAAGTVLSPQQDPQLPFEWKACYWPDAGWQGTGEGLQRNGYVFSPGAWATLRAWQKLRPTRRFASQTASPNPLQKPVSVQVPIPKIVFFLFFLLGAAYLWIEKKLM